MLRYKDWKSINESYDFNLGLGQPKSVVGVVSNVPLASLEEILEARKKAKKKMDFGGKPEEDDPEDDDDFDKPEDEDEDKDLGDEDGDEDAETGDGEVVDPASEKDKPEDDDEEKPAPLMMKKGMKADKKKKDKKKNENSEAEEFNQTIQDMMGFTPQKYFDGITYSTVSEDALLPLIDPNTGLVVEQP